MSSEVQLPNAFSVDLAEKALQLKQAGALNVTLDDFANFVSTVDS
jgi:hypothetical protein